MPPTSSRGDNACLKLSTEKEGHATSVGKKKEDKDVVINELR